MRKNGKIDLERLETPIIFRGDERTAYRDPAILYENGYFHLFFTLVETEGAGEVYMYTAKSRSSDLKNWDKPVKLTPKNRSLNFSSPGNVIAFGGKWILCLQTYCRENGEKYGNGNCRIFVMESDDPEHFDNPRMLLLKGDTPAEELGRMIDPYLLEDGQEPGKWWCFYKQNGVSMSYSHDLIHWEYAGRCEAGENVCVIARGKKYYMFHSPQNGIGLMESEDCRSWKDTGLLFTLGQEKWDWAKGRITAGTVIDAAGILDEEHRYLMFFHGSGPEDETTMFDQYASIGIAWSEDLYHWHWPGEWKKA